MSAAGTGGYDAVELRRRIVVCFSVGELRALAESLGVGGVAWDRGLDEAAREVVRQSAQYAGLPALVARLRELRPLVEWPEPTPAAAPEAAPAPAALAVPVVVASAPLPTLASAAPIAPLSLAPPVLSASPATLGAPLRDPYAPPPGPLAVHVPAPAPVLPPSAAWPGTTTPPAQSAARGIDARVHVAVAALMLAAAIIAYFAGRAGSTSAPADAASSAAPRAPGTKSDGPAAAAADAIARSYANLARVCELPPSVAGSEVVFRRAFERCGPGSPTRRPGAVPPATPSAVASDAPAADPTVARAARPARDPGAAPAPSRGCMGGCDAQHATCRTRCGGEPTESSAYDVYQRCLGRCLADASRCRLGCR